MTDITELAQSLKAAAEKATQGEWRRASTQFNGITATPFMLGRKEVIIAGASEKRDAEFIAMAHPANILALVEALEKAQQRISQLESRTATVENLQDSAYRAGLTAGWNLGLANNNDGFNKCLAAHAAGIKVEAE
ncbi:ead/Ea22-like family protein [Klebsiella pneumoniae]|uniref:ead/Ea22-like family protein n=1 Tax=Klebsiella pneumoniae TaxID=573 RepID=UPI001FAD5B99|nr:ead/Ea22-like family protein [Klebsiella pneumoniae]MCI7885466.1 ead/Ea22-like family protein [Klebsiella pneumoniae]